MLVLIFKTGKRQENTTMTGAIDVWPKPKVSKSKQKEASLAYVALFSPNSKSFSFSGRSDENNIS